MNKTTLYEHLSAGEVETFVALLILSFSERKVEDILNKEYSTEVASEVQVLLAHPTEGLVQWRQKRDVILSFCRKN